MNNQTQSTPAAIALRALFVADDYGHFEEVIETALIARATECARARFVAALALLGFDPAHVGETMTTDYVPDAHKDGGAVDVAYTFGEGVGTVRLYQSMRQEECDFRHRLGVATSETNPDREEEASSVHALGYVLAKDLNATNAQRSGQSETAHAADRWSYEQGTETVIERAARARQIRDEAEDAVYDANTRYQLARASARLAQWAIETLGYTRAQVEGIIAGEVDTDETDDERYIASFRAPDDDRLNFHGFLTIETDEIAPSVTVAAHFPGGFIFTAEPVSSLAGLGGFIENAESANAAQAAKKSARGGK